MSQKGPQRTFEGVMKEYIINFYKYYRYIYIYEPWTNSVVYPSIGPPKTRYSPLYRSPNLNLAGSSYRCTFIYLTVDGGVGSSVGAGFRDHMNRAPGFF